MWFLALRTLILVCRIHLPVVSLDLCKVGFESFLTLRTLFGLVRLAKLGLVRFERVLHAREERKEGVSFGITLKWR